MNRIIQNEVKCLKCEEIIWSAHRHDYKSCKCGSIAVDGGRDYLRRVGDFSNVEERSMSMDEEAIHKCIEAVKWGKKSGRNEYGISLAVIRALRDTGYLNMEKFKGE